jgi:hypothetical protein
MTVRTTIQTKEIPKIYLCIYIFTNVATRDNIHINYLVGAWRLKIPSKGESKLNAALWGLM